MDTRLKRTLRQVAQFYDDRKVGDVGCLGFRRSTDLSTLFQCLPSLLDKRIIVPRQTQFMDLGCADGRVNVFLSYLVRLSVGVELDEWTLEEYGPLRSELEASLRMRNLQEVPENILLFHGDATDKGVHSRIAQAAKTPFHRFDLFYTYLVMHQEFGDLIGREAKPGATFLVYGLDRIMPRLNGLRLMEELSPLGGALGVYQKV